MKRTQKLLLLMAVLVMVTSLLNAAYKVEIRLNFTEEYGADMYDTQLGVYELSPSGWQGDLIGNYNMPYSATADNEEDLYGFYQPIGLDLPYQFSGWWHTHVGQSDLSYYKINSDTEWDENEDGDFVKLIEFDWYPDEHYLTLRIWAYSDLNGDIEPVNVYIQGPTAELSGWTNQYGHYYHFVTGTADEIFGRYTVVGDSPEPCTRWQPSYFDVDWDNGNWQDNPAKYGRAGLDGEIVFWLERHNDWTINAVDDITGNPIPGATVWYDSDCEGEEEPWAVGITDENGVFVFTSGTAKAGEFNDLPVGSTEYQGSGCYYLTHPSYIAWDPDKIRQQGEYLPEACSFTEFRASKGVPVELSSFTATISAQNNVALTWVTETETGMRGYYVHRAEINDLASAQTVSPLIASGNSSQQHTYHYEDAELQDSGIYYYWLEASDLDGSSSFHGPVSVLFNAAGDNPTPEIPLLTQLHSVYPNPFNPMAFIPFSLAKDSAVDIKIYNSRGQMVKHFELGAKAAGMHRISWDGTDYNGNILSNGVYNIVMNAGKDSYQTKAVLLK